MPDGTSTTRCCSTRCTSATSCRRSRYDVTATTVVLGAFGGRDWRPMHHDHNFAVERNGVRDIFLNTTGAGGVLRALRHRLDRARPAGSAGSGFNMRSPVFPGETMVITGTVTKVEHRRHRLRLGRARLRAQRRRRRPRHRLAPASPSPPPLTTTPGPAAASAGGPELRGRRWISTSPPSRRCSAKPSPACARATRASTWCGRWRTTRSGYPDKFWEQLAELGLLGMTLPEELRRERDVDARRDGRLHGARPRAGAVAALRELGDERRCHPRAAGSDAQRDEWLPAIAAGEVIVTPAWLEPGRGFGPEGVQLARRRPTATAGAHRHQAARAVRGAPPTACSCSRAPPTAPPASSSTRSRRRRRRSRSR